MTTFEEYKKFRRISGHTTLFNMKQLKSALREGFKGP